MKISLETQAMANELVSIDKANSGFCYGILNFTYNLIAGQFHTKNNLTQ